uniref:Uncharacterized protein TCIL3000_5_1710 n=1 Tax=Trypanosoma congolense (strain IL3000) TaxID=1068625 RepID=G0UMR0_TRYCI|nr:unnamed protein product [Trypanosoma congolense IL3000]
MYDDDPEVAKCKQNIIDVGQRSQLDLLQAEVRRNKESLTTLRLENKRLNVMLQQALRGQRCGVQVDPMRREEELLHNKLCMLKRSLNSVQGKKEELTQAIAKTVEETGYILKEGDPTIDENSAVAQKIRGLENRLDKCLIKHNEVNAIRRTYEVLLDRLQQEQAGFDTQLAAMEKTLQNKEKDLSDLNTVAAEASSGRDAAKAEVSRLKAQLTRERQAQNKDIEERRAFVQTKRRQLDRKEQRLQEKIERKTDRRSCPRSAGGSSQKKGARVVPQSTVSTKDVELQQQLREAYNKLKEVTMSTNVDEVISKLREREDANVQLNHTAREALKIDALLKEEQNSLTEEWEKLQQQDVAHNKITQRMGESKASVGEERGPAGDGSASNVADQRALVRRRVLEEFESYLNERKNELNDAQRVQDVVGQLLLDIEAGVQHIAYIVACATSNVVPTALTAMLHDDVGDSELDHCIARGDAIIEVMQSAAGELEKMLEAVGDEKVSLVTKSLFNWRCPIPASNVCVRLDTSQSPAEGVSGDMDVETPDELESNEKARRSSTEEMTIGSRKWLGAAVAMTTPADEFPENEIHDRHELKLMSLATVERERKKARKLLQQRVKDEGL